MAACHHSRGIDLCYCTGMGEDCRFVYSLPCIAILRNDEEDKVALSSGISFFF
jgi:hypothetical protein